MGRQMQPKIKISQWQKLSTQQLKHNILILENKMLGYQKQTDYVNAQLFRQLHKNCQKYMQQKQFEDMQQKHNNQMFENNQQRRNRLKQFNVQFEGIFNDFMRSIETNSKQIYARHNDQLQNIHDTLVLQWPSKVKQSHQLLNLRAMEMHAANQKNYKQAQSIKLKADRLYKQQLSQWIATRDNKIQTLQNSLRKKQQSQSEVITSRNKQKLQDLQYERVMGQQSINQNFDVKLKQLKAQHQRQILSLFGQLRNMGGISPPKNNNKSRKDTATVVNSSN